MKMAVVSEILWISMYLTKVRTQHRPYTGGTGAEEMRNPEFLRRQMSELALIWMENRKCSKFYVNPVPVYDRLRNIR